MATYFGNDGSVTIGATGVSFNVTQWQASVEIDAAVAPAAFGEDWEEAELTSGRVTGSLTGKLGSDTVLDLPADGSTWSSFKGELTLTMSTGKSLSGTALFTVVAPTLARAGYGEISVNFRSAGPWTGISNGSS